MFSDVYLLFLTVMSFSNLIMVIVILIEQCIKDIATYHENGLSNKKAFRALCGRFRSA